MSAERPTPPTAALGELADYADRAIGDTASREGDAYLQGVRDLAASLAGREPMPDRLGIGTLAAALEGSEWLGLGGVVDPLAHVVTWRRVEGIRGRPVLVQCSRGCELGESRWQRDEAGARWRRDLHLSALRLRP